MCLAHLGEREAALAIEAAAVNVLRGLPGLSGPAMGMDTGRVGREIAEQLGQAPAVTGRSVMDDLAASAMAGSAAPRR
jgi:3-isopropylmalate dehydrogenase